MNREQAKAYAHDNLRRRSCTEVIDVIDVMLDAVNAPALKRPPTFLQSLRASFNALVSGTAVILTSPKAISAGVAFGCGVIVAGSLYAMSRRRS